LEADYGDVLADCCGCAVIDGAVVAAARLAEVLDFLAADGVFWTVEVVDGATLACAGGGEAGRLFPGH